MRASRPTIDAVVVFCLLVALGASSRMAKEWLDLSLPNLHAVTATAIFAGCYFSRRAVAALVPLAAMLLSDQVVGPYQPLVMAAVYASLAAPVLFRGWFHDGRLLWRNATGAVAASVLFFFVTNLAVWWTSYAHTWSGLGQCYLAAVPFFGYTLAGDLMATCGLFAGSAALAAWLESPQRRACLT